MEQVGLPVVEGYHGVYGWVMLCETNRRKLPGVGGGTDPRLWVHQLSWGGREGAAILGAGSHMCNTHTHTTQSAYGVEFGEGGFG